MNKEQKSTTPLIMALAIVLAIAYTATAEATPLRVDMWVGAGLSVSGGTDKVHSATRVPSLARPLKDSRDERDNTLMLSMGVEVSKGHLGVYGSGNTSYLSAGILGRFEPLTVFLGTTTRDRFEHKDMTSFMTDSEQPGRVGMTCYAYDDLPLEVGIHTNGRIQFYGSAAWNKSFRACASAIDYDVSTVKDLRRESKESTVSMGIRMSF